jgi:hypothetical protein
LSFALSYPIWFVAICLAVGLLFAFAYYFKDKTFNTGLKWFLGVLRFLSGFIISFLLLNPLLKWFSTETLKPLIAIVQDNSASQNKAFSTINRKEYETKLDGLIKNLEKDFVVKRYTYGNSLKDSNALSYTEGSTNISEPLIQVANNHVHENLGAIIVTGDGINNAGESAATLKLNTNASVYAVGVGDTTLSKDALIAKTYSNKVVYSGDQFSVKVDAAGIACNGSSPNVQIIHNNSGKAVFTQRIAFQGNRSSRQVEAILNAPSVGLQHYTAIVSSVDGEQNTVNNKQDFYVEVIGSKEKILLLANSPHPDIYAIQTALTQNKNAELDIKLAANAANVNLSEYNLLILHNLPSTNNNVLNIINNAKAQNMGMLYVVGAQTALASFNAAQNATNIITEAGGQNEVGAVFGKGFTYFTYTSNEAEKLATLPPLNAPFGQYKTGPNTQVLLNQKIGSSVTQNPLLALQQNGAQRVGVLSAEGIWRWRIYDNVQHKSQDAVDGLLKKAIQFLTVKQDKKKFRVSCSKSVFNLNEGIHFDAELYNDNYELINTGDVNIVISDGKSGRYTHSFNKQERNFSLNINPLPPGSYSYEAKSAANGISRTEKGNFKVVDIDIENSNTTADFAAMNQLAKNNNGEFVFAQQVGELYDKIKKNDQIKSVITKDLSVDPLINWHWLLGVVIALLSLEWFLRKRNGGN